MFLVKIIPESGVLEYQGEIRLPHDATNISAAKNHPLLATF